MKKIFLFLIVLAVFGNNLRAQKANFNTQTNINYLTKLSQKVGISELKLISRVKNNYSFSVSFNVNTRTNSSFDFKTKICEIEENNLSLILKFENVQVKYKKEDKSIEIKYDRNDFISLKEFRLAYDDKDGNTIVGIALILLDEMTNNESPRNEVFNNNETSRKIGSWYVLNGGWSQSTSIADTQTEVNQFLTANPNCQLHGTLDTSCAWGNHICVSTQYFDCK